MVIIYQGHVIHMDCTYIKRVAQLIDCCLVICENVSFLAVHVRVHDL